MTLSWIIDIILILRFSGRELVWKNELANIDILILRRRIEQYMKNTKSLYACSYKEVMTILGYLSINDLSKIPIDKLEFFLENMDDTYEYELDKTKSFQEQKMLPVTEAILANLFTDYLSIPFQAKNGADIVVEDIFNQVDDEEIEEEICEEDAKPEVNIIEYKPTFFCVLVQKIKKWFWRWRHTDKEL